MIKRNYRKREKIKIRIKKKIFGTSERPRLSVYRSLNQIYAQIIDDDKGITLASASSLSKEISEQIKATKGKVEKSKLVGNLIAKLALEKNIKQVVFDRNGFRYHGRVKALADGAREGGLQF
ncbi:MAG: 50S ribosomal protein L18 [Ignavibacterium sp.]|nr:50S ribosomal protein L18 [Ignavibacterium sp.]MCX7612438.1 50S ribosomal protein L18 [Ignavibacterium sp.]MDW8374556.1 50S ribosomal protein L18 [Ignavibacteriales bacterium]